jgi:hypothetical protein
VCSSQFPNVYARQQLCQWDFSIALASSFFGCSGIAARYARSVAFLQARLKLKRIFGVFSKGHAICGSIFPLLGEQQRQEVAYVRARFIRGEAF